MNKTYRLMLAAMFFALGLILPFFIGQIPAIGKMLLPMHIPVLFCGLIVGWQYGLLVGFFLPLTCSILFGMPAFFPNAVAMSFELATYGLVVGFLYSHSKWQCVKALYRCLIAAMLAGRLVWGVAEILLLGLSGSAFTWELFLAGAFLNAIPGIVLQLILIPAVMVSLNRAKIVPFKRETGWNTSRTV
ncbi:MAG: ECF transporter S component [Lachnospiraceae bacterium]|nr:ECF transporter S component [Lachnospiraceae bacterium]